MHARTIYGCLERARYAYLVILFRCYSNPFKHLVRHGEAARSPVAEIERPAINRDEGTTLAFAKAQARKMLDAPAEDSVAGLRDRALLSVGLQVGLRRAEIAALTVGNRSGILHGCLRETMQG